MTATTLKRLVQRVPSSPVLLFFALSAVACSDDGTGPGGDIAPDFSGRAGYYTLASFDSDARGRVYFNVYLPPGWPPEGGETYPLVIFLHGQSGDEFSFTQNVPASELSQWIEQGLVPPFVLVAPRGSDVPNSVQWYYPENVALLTSESPSELRAFCWETFRAGGNPRRISVHGHSRGASGALYFALNHWGSFASAVANAFVSDYVLDERRADATRNRDEIVESGIALRMTIGTEDSYTLELGRVGSPELHRHLDTLGIPHEYEVLPGATHGFSSLWYYLRNDGLQTGLYEMQLHAQAWARGR
jgi:enterochelin esterase-like enzyme